jgi:hypothetical protein
MTMAAEKPRLHKKATYTLPPDVIDAIDKYWRFHKTVDATLADSKSAYVADLVRRDSAKQTRAEKARLASS